MRPLFDVPVLKAAAAGSNHTADPLDASEAFNGSFQCKWTSLTGTLNAVFQVQCSDDGVIWDDKTGATITVSGASGHDTISLDAGLMTEKFYQLDYRKNGVSGGTVDARAFIKG